MSQPKYLVYTGEALENPVTARRITKEGERKESLEPYLPAPELINAVNLALLLQRPLLLMGEPGCGKSKLAEALAYELHQDEPDYLQYYYEWHIKSNTKAKEGLYDYDAIQRLGDAQVSRKPSRLNKRNYIKDGPLGLAIKNSSENKRAVLLIDEIDKADLDFPNDLLNELDRGEYTIPEINETVKAEIKPIIIITSNQEKDLPDAFLRRCIYHFIDPLDKPLLTKILKRRFYKEEDQADDTLIEKAVDRFLDIRKELTDKKLMVGKNISTSELIDWFSAIKFYAERMEEIAKSKKEGKKLRQDLEDMKALTNQLEEFEKKTDSIPFQQVLFKNHPTLLNFKKS